MQRVFLGVLFVLLGSTPVRAVLIGNFPGLERLVEAADAIVVVRIDDHLVPIPDDTLYSSHRCFVVHSLKGSIEPGSRLSLKLMVPGMVFESPFSVYSTHLVFLRRSEASDTVDYRVLQVQGSCLRVSPVADTKKLKGKSVYEQIRALIAESIAFWDEHRRREVALQIRVTQ
jgi:hypothetical protein